MDGNLWEIKWILKQTLIFWGIVFNIKIFSSGKVDENMIQSMNLTN